MSIFITIIVFILIFSLLILVHEFGHFIMAKRAGIKVEEFGFGLPPKIWGKKKGETTYSINWIPFGGFVRMLGEDSSDPAALKQKRSFAAQPMRARVKVIVAGVVMNFFLAWLLLTVGFTVGMQPLLGPEDVLPAVDSGLIKVIEGAKVKSIEGGSLAEYLGMQEDDVLVEKNDRFIDYNTLNNINKEPLGIYDVVRGGEVFVYEVTEELIDKYNVLSGDGLGVEFYDFAPFPRVRVYDLSVDSIAYKAGLRKGDVLLTVNGRQVYSVREFEDLVRDKDVLEYIVYRGGVTEEVVIELLETRRVIISELFPGMPGEKVGLLEDDVIVSVNGIKVTDSLELINYVEEMGDNVLAYIVERNGQELFFEITPEEGKIGVYLSELITYGEQELSLYNIDLLSSVDRVNEEKYPVYVAFYKSFGESVRMSELTARMFIGVVVDLLSGQEVPDGVAGPVGIAQLTHVFVQEGFIPVIRFVAVLSLSLAVINILPFPALDGGRLFFILLEFILGRKVNQKWESVIHAIGYVLILILIFVVTYSDIVRAIGL